MPLLVLTLRRMEEVVLPQRACLCVAQVIAVVVGESVGVVLVLLLHQGGRGRELIAPAPPERPRAPVQSYSREIIEERVSNLLAERIAV